MVYFTGYGNTKRSLEKIAMSRLLRICETKIRGRMHDFIDHEVDMTTFERPDLFHGDLGLCKTEMHQMARVMDLTVEMEYLVSELAKANHSNRQRMQSEIASYRNISDDQITSRMIHLPSEENQQSPTIDLDINSHILDQNIRFIDLLLHISSYPRIQCRLIEYTKRYFATSYNRSFIANRRERLWIDINFFSSKFDSTYLMANLKAKHASARDSFMARAGLQPPRVLRLIDIEATCRNMHTAKRVVLIDYWADGVKQIGYTAISHTYGMDVYTVFDCSCASEYSAKVHPRCSDKPCLHDQAHQDASLGASTEKHKRVVDDILRMCTLLKKAGVLYAWHDGVCIAQHDESEVQETIKHIGWIYGFAKETVIFLHYVGSPMAPIRNSNDQNNLCCRWHTRVWTLQEAALSKCRRYCVRVGATPFGDCQSMEEFVEKIDLWYRESSSTIEIMEEERFLEYLQEIERVLWFLCGNMAKMLLLIPDDANDDVIVESNWMWVKASLWFASIEKLLQTLSWTCFEFPTLERALVMCGSRESKHRGDKINSILALAEVNDFAAPKDVDVEASTMEFFKRQGQLGLARALLFSINAVLSSEDKQYFIDEHRHTWLPVLWSPVTFLCEEAYVDDGVRLKVLEEDGSLELRGDMVGVGVRFTANFDIAQHRSRLDDQTEFPKMSTKCPKLSINKNDLTCLNMDLIPFDAILGKFKAKLFGTSQCILGEVRISAILGKLATEIKDGESFHVQLVSPVRTKILPHLIVQGSLLANVSKVGVFEPNNKFIQMVNQMSRLPAITNVKKLIII